MPALKVLNSVDSVVERTESSRSKIYREMKSGRLDFVWLGSRRRIPETALQSYLSLLESESAARKAA